MSKSTPLFSVTLAMSSALPEPERSRKVVEGVRAIRLLPTAVVLASCAATSPMAELDWNGFVASFAGEPQKQAEYVTGTVKVAGSAEVTASIAAGNARFERWCSAHGGRGDLTQVLARSSSTANAFHNGLVLKSNAEQARGLGWRPIDAVACVDGRSGELFAARAARTKRCSHMARSSTS